MLCVPISCGIFVVANLNSHGISESFDFDHRKVRSSLKNLLSQASADCPYLGL